MPPPRQRTPEQEEQYRAYHRDYYNRYTKLGLLKGKKTAVRFGSELNIDKDLKNEIRKYWAERPSCTKHDIRNNFNVSLSEAKYLLEHMPIYVWDSTLQASCPK
jgi:hypothetical protein